MDDLEKVINELARIREGHFGGMTSYEGEVLDAALALLKAQEPCEDWINRKQLKDEIQYYIDEAGWGEEVNKALGWCLEFIDHQEAVKWE